MDEFRFREITGKLDYELKKTKELLNKEPDWIIQLDDGSRTIDLRHEIYKDMERLLEYCDKIKIELRESRYEYRNDQEMYDKFTKQMDEINVYKDILMGVEVVMSLKIESSKLGNSN